MQEFMYDKAYRSDISWIEKWKNRKWRRSKTFMEMSRTEDEILVLRKRVNYLTVEVQEWRQKVGDRRPDMWDDVRLAMSQRGYLPICLTDDDFKQSGSLDDAD